MLVFNKAMRASKFGLSFAYAVLHFIQNYAYRYFGLLHLAIQRTSDIVIEGWRHRPVGILHKAMSEVFQDFFNCLADVTD